MNLLILLTYFFVGVVVISHFLFMVMEMFFWLHPRVRKIFSMSEENARVCKALAANVGLYNGFLAIGLCWGLLDKNIHTLTFFLVCIIIAGLVGAITAKRSILYIQALPALIALILVRLVF